MFKPFALSLIAFSALLSGCGGNPPPQVAESPLRPARAPDLPTAFPVSAPDPVRSTSTEDPRFFPELMKSVRTSMTAGGPGLRSVVRFFNQGTGLRTSFIVDGGEGFKPVKGSPERRVAFFTGVEGEILSVFVASLEPGHYDCTKPGFAIGFSFTGDLPLADGTAWSDVGDGYCSFDVSPGPTPGDVEARFSGLLVSNDLKAVYLIDDGYFFSRRGVTSP
ncbi:MAG: hypothetical protein BWY99_01802 [Synergistetes bacterium ADurb.BinA166]|nr:MAG: hypothetical protein BWY99_01802 [Synergistetes bacterium ADurb.BinA166]